MSWIRNVLDVIELQPALKKLIENLAHNESSHSDLDWQERRAPPSPTTLCFGRKNKPCKPVECLSHPQGVCKHNTVATVILMVNPANPFNHTDIFSFILHPDTDSYLRLLTRSVH